VCDYDKKKEIGEIKNMAKVLDDSALKQILEELGSSVYFYQKEKEKARDSEKELYEPDGSVIVTFISGVVQVEPGKEDSLGKIWNPPIKDKDGNPELDKSGRPKKAWSKFEIKSLIKGKEKIYGLGSDFGAQLRGVISEMTKNGLKSAELPGTQWKFKSLGNYKWDVEYVGKVELPKETNGKKPNSKESNLDAVKKGILSVKEKASLTQKLAGLEKNDFINAVGFFAEVEDKKIHSIWKEILELGIIKEENGKIFFI